MGARACVRAYVCVCVRMRVRVRIYNACIIIILYYTIIYAGAVYVYAYVDYLRACVRVCGRMCVRWQA